MEVEAKRNELQALLEAIKGSDVLEKSLSLISQLEDSFQSAKDHLDLLVEYLPVFWEESTCSGLSHCMINKTVLQIAIKCIEIDKVTSLSQFLIIGSKASLWCENHLNETIVSIDESEDQNHSNIFQQILFDTLNFSSNLVSSLTSSPIRNCNLNSMLIIETFLSQLLNLTKSSIKNNQKSGTITQVILEGTKILCIKYSELTEINNLEQSKIITKITTHAIQTLYELGVFAASGGGAHVSILNISWKGVVALLQANKGNLNLNFEEGNIRVYEIVKTLILLSIDILKAGSETWCLANEVLSASDAKRAFLPIKFFLINAVRICSVFPSEIMGIYKEIMRFVLVIANLGFYFSKETKLKSAGEALAEFVDPTSLLLLQTVFNSFGSDSISKFGIFECIFEKTKLEPDFPKMESSDLLGCIFSTDFNTLLTGRVILFSNLLRASQFLNEIIVIELSKNVDNFFDILIDERIYPFVLGLEIPVLYNSKGNGTAEMTYQPLYNFVIQSLKTFIITASAGEVVFSDLETIFLENLIHPHFLVSEIATEMLCFILRNSENALTNQIMENILSLLKLVNNAPFDDLRRIARVSNTLLSYVGPNLIDSVYISISSDEYYNNIYLVLLMEGFPFENLSDNSKRIAIQKRFTAFNAFMEGYFRENGGSSFNLTGHPVHALASALQYCNLKDFDMLEEKTIHLLFKFSNSLINNYKNTTNNSTKSSLAKLIGFMLDIVSAMKFLYKYAEMSNLITDLHSIFVPNNTNTTNTNFLHNYKPSLARFISSISHMNLPEEEGNSLCTNIWYLNHVLLRERNWALVHFAISSFGYFAARTSCTQLWRFVPDDAALSYDTETGTVSEESRFMCELKAFLEKERGLNIASLCDEEIERLEKEAKLVNKIVDLVEKMEIREEGVLRKKRKVMNGISEGVGLLRSGLKVMKSLIDGNEIPDLRGEFSSHVSCLEDVISNLVSFSEKH